MSIKTTQYITRNQAMRRLMCEIMNLSNELLEKLLDDIADSDEGVHISRFDNFKVGWASDDESE